MYVINSMAMLRGVTSDTSQIDKMVRDQKLEKVRMGKGEEGEPAQKGPMTVQEEVVLVTQRSQLTPATLPAARYPLCRCYRYIQCSDLVYHARYATGCNQKVGKDILEPLRGAVWLYEMPSNAVSLGLKFLLPPQVIQLTSSIRATHHQSEASDPTQMMNTPVYQEQSFHSSHLPPPPIPATNRNSAFQFGLDHCEFPGLYKPAFPDPRQDLNTTPSRVNNSGSGFSSPSLLQPCTKLFSGRPARPQMTCPTREAGEAIRERPGAVFPLQPRAQRPDTRVAIEAALPEAAVADRRAQPHTVVEIDDTSLPQRASSPRRRASRRQSRKRRCNRSTGVYRPPKRSPPHGRWCE